MFDSVSDRDALRVRERERGHPPAAHRLAGEVRAVGTDRVEDGGHVGDRGVAAVRAAAERRVAEAAAVPRDDAVAGVGERRHLLVPARVRAARAVREHDDRRVVGADHLVVDVLAAARDGAGSPACVIGRAATVSANISAPRARARGRR